MGRLVFVSGHSGAGKTTLAEGLKKHYGFVHFDGESWMCGLDPVAQSAVTPTQEMLANVPPERVALAKDMNENCYAKISAGQEPVHESYERFYAAMLKDVRACRAESEERNMVISHAPYLKIMRNYCRAQLGEDLTVLVINAPVTLLQARVKKRLEAFAAAQGKSLEEFVMQGNIPGKDTFDERMAAMMENVRGLSEGVTGDEPNTFEIEVTADMGPDAVLAAAFGCLGISEADANSD
eukprot:TRINITY_DN57184_c0_g1_i1.p1 TRINITY_DN57184_c0_g1~~TRINITY_DN57184_c0_g1_i1.p1  ORF type:complete len:238 (+),score=43.11 TRINITY_DN57184_c0_g1_i1:121-834(+)